MALRVADRVRETTTTTGTGPLSLGGALPGFIPFSAIPSIAVSDTVFYCTTFGTDWEVGLGTYSATNTLTRTTILASSNGNAAVSWTAGTKDVFLTMAASQVRDLIDSLNTVTAQPKTAAFTLDLSMIGQQVEYSNSSAANATIPPDTTAAFPAGSVVFIMQMAAGVVTVALGSGVTLNPSITRLKTNGAGSLIALRKTATANVWQVVGGIA